MLPTFAVDVIGEALDSAAKTLRVRDDRSVGLTTDLPAIVDVDVLVACGLHSTADHHVGNLADELLAHVTAKLVPAIPAHRRSWREKFRRRDRSLCLGRGG